MCRRLVFHIRIDAIEQTLPPQFRQLAVEIFTRLAEKFIGGIAEAKDGEGGVVELRRFFREQKLTQRNGFFRRLAFALRGRDHDQQLFIGDLFEFVVARINQRDAQFCRQQVIAQGFRHAPRIAGLRCRNKRNTRHFSDRRWRGGERARLLVQHSPEIAGNPGKLGGRKIGCGRLKACQLLRV